MSAWTWSCADPAPRQQTTDELQETTSMEDLIAPSFSTELNMFFLPNNMQK